MYHKLRSLHRWVGLLASLFLLLVSATGFLLATKSSFGWVRPPEQEGQAITSLVQTVTLNHAAEAAFALGIAELRSMSDIDRIDYRPKRNIFKVVSKEGYHEVQVDGSSGEVLSVAFRLDQMTEDFHDLSFFHDALNVWLLPVVALSLFILGATGVVIFLTPIVRRARFRRKQRSAP